MLNRCRRSSSREGVGEGAVTEPVLCAEAKRTAADASAVTSLADRVCFREEEEPTAPLFPFGEAGEDVRRESAVDVALLVVLARSSSLNASFTSLTTLSSSLLCEPRRSW